MKTVESVQAEVDLSLPQQKEREEIVLQHKRGYDFLKRIFDMIVSFLALILFSPGMVILALIIKLESRGPIIFAHLRTGKDGRNFRIYKFRSMYLDAEERRTDLKNVNEMEGPLFKIKDDPRITPFGRFLRKSSLDELPQLVNILKGDMSLVGPRPLVFEDVNDPTPATQSNQKEKHLYFYWMGKRLEVKPGLTGLWQVSGRNCLPLEGWIEYDLKYIQRRSLLLDLQILLRTIPVVLSGKGAL